MSGPGGASGPARVGIVAAVSADGVIGVDGRLPWRYPGDLRRFKRLTVGGTVIMGRATWESIGSRPLPDRRNIVVTRADLPGVECFRDLPSAIRSCTGPVWLIGGARIFEEGMEHADFLDITYVPNRVGRPNAVRFPPIDPAVWEPGPVVPHEDEPALTRRRFERRRR